MNSRDLFYSIGGIDEELIELAQKKKEVNIMSRKIKIILSAAACLAVVAVLAGAFGAGLFSPDSYTVTLENGENCVFGRTTIGSASLDFQLPAACRELSGGELSGVFPFAGENASGVCYFDDGSGLPVRFDGKLGGVSVIIAGKGQPLSDTVIDETPAPSLIGGTPVMLGYFLTDANSRGERNAIFCATFAFGDYTVYVEDARDSDNASLAAEAVADTVSGIIAAAPDAFASLRQE